MLGKTGCAAEQAFRVGSPYPSSNAFAILQEMDSEQIEGIRYGGEKDGIHSVYRSILNAKTEILYNIALIESKQTRDYANIIIQNLEVILSDIQYNFKTDSVKERIH